MSEQVPPADELAATRDAIKTLERREAELKAVLLADKSARTGNTYIAEIVAVTQQRLDVKELRACHPDICAAYTFPQTITKVELRIMDEETGEIVARPKRKAE